MKQQEEEYLLARTLAQQGIKKRNDFFITQANKKSHEEIKDKTHNFSEDLLGCRKQYKRAKKKLNILTFGSQNDSDDEEVQKLEDQVDALKRRKKYLKYKVSAAHNEYNEWKKNNPDYTSPVVSDSSSASDDDDDDF